MTLPSLLANRLRLPAICAPMKDVSGPPLVLAALKAGIVGALPAHNARNLEEFEAWLEQLRRDVDTYRESGRDVGVLAVNVAQESSAEEQARFFKACKRAGVEIFISVFGDPTDHIRRVHDHGGLAFHDVTTVRHAEKALAAGADGLIAIGAGGGGHSGVLSPLAFIPLLRAMFDGPLIMAGAVSTGATIRSGEILGADLAYLGTRFIATQESSASALYKQAIASGSIADLIYTNNPTGVSANWLRQGLRRLKLDPDALPQRVALHGSSHYPAGLKPWRDIGSAGQGIGLIDDIPAVADLVERLRKEYAEACAVPSFAGVLSSD